MSKSASQDKYYTKYQAAMRMMSVVHGIVDLTKFDNVVEPSAGNGSLLDMLPPGKRIGVDLYPERDDITKHDFLTWKFPEGSNAVIMNPPFGKSSNLATQFFNRCAEHAEFIACIVPMTWAFFEQQDRLDPNWSLIYFEKLPFKSFECDGKDKEYRTCIQVWVKDISKYEGSRNLRYLTKPSVVNDYFEFTRHNQDWDFAISTYGQVPRFYDKNDPIPERTHVMYIKEKNTGVRKVLESADWRSIEIGKHVSGTVVSSIRQDTILNVYLDQWERLNILQG